VTLDPVFHVAYARDLVALLAFGAAAMEARGRRGVALVVALAAVVAATGFWSVAMRRPYGLLVDPAQTRWAADVMVAAHAGGTDRFLAGEPGGWTVGRALTRVVPPNIVLAVPELLPPVVIGASVVAVAFLWPAPQAKLAAILWAGGSTGALESLRGFGLLDSIWSRPGRAIAWVAAVVLVLGLSRMWRSRPRLAAGAIFVVLAAATFGHGPTLSIPSALLLLTLDQHLWLAGGVLGLRGHRDVAAASLIAGGAILVLLGSSGAAIDVWAAAAFYRLGLVLASSQALELAARWMAESEATRRLAAPLHAVPDHLLTAAVAAIVLAGGYAAWWSPLHTDPVAKESLAPVPDALREATEWIRNRTDSRGTFIANEDYAPAIAALAGRRVLRAPGLLEAPDEERRRRLERAVFTGRWPEALRARYDVRYVFLGPGQFSEYGIEAPEQLASRGPFRQLYANDKGMRVYELRAQSSLE
jgi:hypothetical protein